MTTPIERLRKRHRLCVVPCFDHSLVGDRAHCLTCAVTWPCDTVAALDALEYELDLAREAYDKLQAENARLRKYAQSGAATFEDLYVRDREIARLRGAIGLATTAAPTMEMDAADPVGMMQRVVAEIDTLREQVEALKAAVLDIDAHSTAMGEDTDGFTTGGYIVSVGALHRALGVVGHAARKCKPGALCPPCAQAEALATALRNQGLLQNTFHGTVWHIHDCPASFDFSECHYRCRVAREAFALAGTEPYVSQETRRDTEVYE